MLTAHVCYVALCIVLLSSIATGIQVAGSTSYYVPLQHIVFHSWVRLVHHDIHLADMQYTSSTLVEILLTILQALAGDLAFMGIVFKSHTQSWKLAR